MAGNARRRKRGRQDSDNDDGAAQAGPSTVPNESKPATGSQGEAKRRRLAIETSSVVGSSSPAPLVATSTSRRRNRRQASNIKQPTPPDTASTIKQEDEQELESIGKVKQEENELSPERPRSVVQVPSDTSSLSALSDHDSLGVAKKEESEEVVALDGASQQPVKEEEPESTSEASRPYTRAEKGKGRAKSPPANKQLRDEARRLQLELALLKAQLSTANSTIENHESFLNKVTEAFTCNICLEALRQPLALTCGHVFCQDDLWNWFHRESPDSDSELDDTSGSTSDGTGDSDSSSSADDDVRAALAARRPIGQRIERPPREQPSRSSSENSDLVALSDDYNTDDSLSSTSVSRSPSPVQVRSGARIRTTRGQQVAQQRLANSNPPPPPPSPPVQADTAEDTAPVDQERARSSSSIVITGTSAAPPETAAVTTTGTSSRVPALRRPRRLNLVCPQCRSRISIPPFPIFAIRGVSELLATQTNSRRAGSADAGRESNSIVDPTWGGLFPRAASGIGRSGHAHSHPAPSTMQIFRERWLPQAGDRPTIRERLAAAPTRDSHIPEAAVESEDSSGSDSDSSRSEGESLEELRAQVRQAYRTGETLTEEQHARAFLHNLLSPQNSTGTRSVVGRGSLPSLNGLRRRGEAEHLLVNDGTRQNQLDALTRARDERRRRHRRAPRNHDAIASREEEDSLREVEDRAVATARQALLLSRVDRPRHHATSNRGRDILRHGIRDAEDGVRRCIDCNWEIENGECLHCGAVYDSESEFDENGEDLEDEVTSPPRPTQEASELSFIERDQPSERDLESYADQTDDEGEDLMDSDGSAGTDAEETGSEEGDEDHAAHAHRSGSGRTGGRRKVNRFMFDSEEDELVNEDEDEDESGFFVADNEVEQMATSEGDALLDDEDEAEETDREERRARREERKQAKAARKLQARQRANSSSGYSSSDAEDDEDSSSDDEEDDGDLHQSTSLTSPSVEDEDGTSSKQGRNESEARHKAAKSSLSARERAAKAAMSRNSRNEASIEVQANTDKAKSPAAVSSAPARRKRVIEASDEE